MLKSVVRGLLAVAVLAMTVPGSAFALETYVPVSTFGGPGSGDGQAELREHSGLAVNDATGDIYVADTGNHRIDVFDPSKPEGERFVRAFGADVGGPGVNVCTTGCVAATADSEPGAFEDPRFIAVDNSGTASQGDVYVGDSAADLVSKFGPEGILIGSWGENGQLDGSKVEEPFPGPFGELIGIAVDNSGNLAVGTQSHILFRFAPDGSLLSDFEFARENTAIGIAVDPAGRFYKATGLPIVFRFDSSGQTAPITREESFGGEPPSSLAVDSGNGDLFVAGPHAIGRYSFTSSGNVVGTTCTPVETETEPGCPPTEKLAEGNYFSGASLAVNGSDHVVVVGNPETDSFSVYKHALVPDVETLDVAAGPGVTEESATLPGTISAAGGSAATCLFEYTSEATFEVEGFEGAAITPCTPAGPFAGTAPQAVTGEASGLTPGVSYVFRIVGRNSEGSIPGEASSFTAAQAPTILSGPRATVGATGANVVAQIEPNESVTEFFVQYTTAVDFAQHGYADAISAPAPAAVLPLTSELRVNVRKGQTRYASNEFSVRAGKVTAGASIRGPGIPVGTRIGVVNGTELTLSREPTRSGNQFVLKTIGPQVAAQQLNGLAPATEYRYRLVAKNGVDETVSADQTFTTFSLSSPGLADNRQYELVSPAVKAGQVIPIEPKGDVGGTCPSETGCLPGVNGAFVFPTQALPDGGAVSYTGQPFGENLASGYNQYISRRGADGWETEALSPASLGTGERQGYEAISEGLDRSVVAQAVPALSPEAPTKGGVPFRNLYLRTNSGFEPLIRQTPPHRAPGSQHEGGNNAFETIFAGGNAGTASVQPFTHFVLEANDALTGEVAGRAPAAPEIVEGGLCTGKGGNCDIYEWSSGQLHLINVLPGNTFATPDAIVGSNVSASGPRQVLPDFDNAISANGSRIFWSKVSSGQVYVRIDGRETKKVGDPSSFVDATPDGSAVLLSDGCVYEVDSESCLDLTGGMGGFVGLMGSTPSFSAVYFVDTAVLPGSVPNSRGAEPVEGEDNAYLWRDGKWTYIATLAREDNEGFGNGFFGDWAASSTTRSAQVTSDGRFLAFMSYRSLTGYDNELSGGGACPHSGSGSRCQEVYEYDAQAGTLTCPSCNPTGLPPIGGANLSMISAVAESTGRPQPENLPKSGEGRLFFESRDALLPDDVNGAIQDVYEWEPDGVGTCGTPGGCLSFLSAGTGTDDSFFMAASSTGSDAFIATRQRLLPADKNEQVDLYDAREGGGFAESPTSECVGEGCRSEAQSQAVMPQVGSHGAIPTEEAAKARHKKKHMKKRKRHKKTNNKKQKHNDGKTAKSIDKGGA